MSTVLLSFIAQTMFYKIIFLLYGLVFALESFAQNEKLPLVFKVTVRDSLTGKPLEDATVTISKHTDAHLTTSSGTAFFDTIKPGHYHIMVTFIGYHSYQTVVDLPLKNGLIVLLCPETFHLHEVEIHATSSNELLVYSMQAKAILSAIQIERLRGQNLGDLLNNINGMTSLKTGPGISKPVLRGLHSNRLVLLNNGIKLEDQQWGSEHAPEVDPFNVNQIEVIKGASSVEFGPEAIGGVVRITPKLFRATNGINGEASLQGFSNNKQGASSAMLEGRHFKTNSLSWRVQGSLRKAGDSKAPDYIISNTGLEEANGSLVAAYQYHNWLIEIGSSLFSTKVGIMRAAHIGSSTDLYNAIQSDRPLIINPFTYQIGKPYQQVKHLTSSVKIAYKIEGIGKLLFQLSRQTNSRQEFDLGVSWNPKSVSHASPAYDLTLNTNNYESVFEHVTKHHFTGKVGISLMNQFNLTGGIQKPIIPNFQAITYGVFLFEKWNKGRWGAEAGIRYDHREQVSYARNKLNEVINQHKRFENTTFSFGGGYSLTKKLRLNTSFSSAWRPPAINELYSNGLHNGTATFEIGDSNLRLERSYNLDVNLKYQSNRLVLEWSVFRNTLNDFIYQLPVQPPTITLRGTFPTYHFTQTNVLMQGSEFNASIAIHKNVFATGAISYLYAQDLTNNEPLIFMPANRAKLGLSYNKEQLWQLENFFFELNAQFVTEQKRVPEGLDYKNPPAAYQLLDLNIGCQLPLGKNHLTISATVKNLGNISYRDYLNRLRYFSDEPGRNFILRLTIPFEILTNN